jgi:hypothetical protein
MLDDMKEKGVIKESYRFWSWPVVLVRKKNGELLFCVNYRNLNCLDGVVVSVLATGPKDYGFETGQGD